MNHHVYNFTSQAQFDAFIEHANERLKHFTETGSKSGIRYWKQRLQTSPIHWQRKLKENSHVRPAHP